MGEGGIAAPNKVECVKHSSGLPLLLIINLYMHTASYAYLLFKTAVLVTKAL